MTNCTVTVAAFLSLSSALGDWDSMESADDERPVRLIDAALVEGDAETIRVFHRHSQTGFARGAVASAVVGLLRPPSIVTGAVAGGVGGRVLIVLGRAISRDGIKQLGDVLDAGPIALVALTEGTDRSAWRSLLGSAVATNTTAVEVSADDLRRAVDDDDAER